MATVINPSGNHYRIELSIDDNQRSEQVRQHLGGEPRYTLVKTVSETKQILAVLMTQDNDDLVYNTIASSLSKTVICGPAILFSVDETSDHQLLNVQ